MQLPNPQVPYTNMPAAPRERRHFGALSALLLSFFSADLYRDVARRWRGIGFWYLILLLLITYIPIAVRAQHEVSKGMQDPDVQTAISTFPTINIKQGKVTSDPDPYLWKVPHSNQVILYVDTTGKFDLPQGQNAVAKLSETQIVVRKNPNETQTNTFPPNLDFSVDKNDLSRWADWSEHKAGAFVYAFFFIFGFIWHFIIQMLIILPIIGLILSSMLGAKLNYGALMRLSVIAITPAQLLDAILTLAGVHFSGSGFVFAVIEIVVLFMAIKANTTDRALPAGGFVPGYAAPPVPGYGQPPVGYVQPPAQYPPPGQYPPPQ